MADFYGIENIGEAISYMENEILSNHMNEICEALLKLDTDDEEVFGYLDNLKCKSSMTLFEKTIRTNDIFNKVLVKYFEGKRDPKTLQILGYKLE